METEPPQAAPIPNGIAIAACLAAMIGMLTLGIVVFACEMSKPLAATVHNIGKIWMPGADGIGPYSGKETLALIAWLVSWPVLHFLLRKKQLWRFLARCFSPRRRRGDHVGVAPYLAPLCRQALIANRSCLTEDAEIDPIRD